MNFRKVRSREEPEINLIPFIDVLLVILIFLMITTTYTKTTALQVTLPQANADQTLPQPLELHVIVDAQGRYAINNTRISFRDAAGLASQLQEAAGQGARGQETVVIIHVDALATHQSVVNVLEAASLAGMAQINFAAQTRQKNE